jgi:hypothetical protein
MLGPISLPAEKRHFSDLALAVLADRGSGDLVVKAVRVQSGTLPEVELTGRSCQVFVAGAGLLERHVVRFDSGGVLGVRYAWPRS